MLQFVEQSIAQLRRVCLHHALLLKSNSPDISSKFSSSRPSCSAYFRAASSCLNAACAVFSALRAATQRRTTSLAVSRFAFLPGAISVLLFGPGLQDPSTFEVVVDSFGSADSGVVVMALDWCRAVCPACGKLVD